MGRIVVIGGGARSGKSRFAVRYATGLGRSRLFVATAAAGDDEMRERIAAHREERGDAFTTLEAQTELVEALESGASFDVVLIDCLTFWLSNLLLDGLSDQAVEKHVAGLCDALREARSDVLIVTNEVGCGVVPEHALGRRFRDLAGRAHQHLAAMADEVYVGVMGCMLRLKPGPVSTVEPENWG